MIIGHTKWQGEFSGAGAAEAEHDRRPGYPLRCAATRRRPSSGGL